MQRRAARTKSVSRRFGFALTLVGLFASSGCTDAGGRDADGDGVPLVLDCDGTRASVHPGGTEIPYTGLDEDCDPSTPDDDLDGDGYLLRDDCDDRDPEVHPSASELVYNGIDDDCSPLTRDDDLDGDGHPLASDCDDDDADISPSDPERPYNGVDDDCASGTPDDDLDRDGFALADDCDDSDPDISPADPEVVYNGVDDDCDPGTIDDDLDRDGFEFAADCDDGDPDVSPADPEVDYNGLDDDCDPMTPDDDLDADGALLADDCDDRDPARSSFFTEVPYNGIDDDCDASSPDDDVDGDGHLLATDCDDGDAGVHPGASEQAYNGIDDDCDALTPDDDLDGDGAPLASDCDDMDASRSSLFAEVPYNGIDDDCSAATNDDDVDFDGYLLAADCDDTDASVHPGGTEIPHNGKDDDCDPLSLDDDLDGDGYLVAEDCDDFDSSVNPDATEICGDHVESDCNYDPAPCALVGVQEITTATATISGNAGFEQSGWRVESSGDVNGDGYDDLLIAAHTDGANGYQNGAVYLFYGGTGVAPLAGPIDVDLADAVFLGVGSRSYTGYRIDIAGDLDGDGHDDIVMGAPLAGNSDWRGAVYVYYGGEAAELLSGSMTVNSADAIISGAADSDSLGRGAHGVGDVDGDGYDDLMVGASGVEWSGPQTGMAYLFYGGSGASLIAGTFSVLAADARFPAEGSGDQAGRSLADAGDFNGDGVGDFLVGVHSANNLHGYQAGNVYLFYGRTPSTRWYGTQPLAGADVIFVSESDDDELGVHASGVGDVDGDGVDDILLGAHYAGSSGAERGAAYLFYGRSGVDALSGTLGASSADLVVRGVNDGDQTGIFVGGGDVNGDGFADFMIGSSGFFRAGIGNASAAHLFYGRPTRRTGSRLITQADFALLSSQANAEAGHGLSIGGDLNADGYDDIVVGAHGVNGAFSGSFGATYVFYGQGI